MSKIKIKNFGPIKDGFKEILADGTVNEWIDIKKVTLFIGNQGSGKSTVAKLISTFMWMEKSLLNGKLSEITVENFINDYCGYFRLKRYFRTDSQLSYEGRYYTIKYGNEKIDVKINKHEGAYEIAKIMYVPAERSFLSSVEDAENVTGLPLPLFTFMDENNRSLEELQETLPLPIGSYRLQYDHIKNISYIVGADYELELSAASSGLHSVVPLYVVSRNLAISIKDKIVNTSKSQLNYRQEQKRKAELKDFKTGFLLEDLSDEEVEKREWIIESKYTNSVFTNIVEEPEQNRFPTPQKKLLDSLLEFNNMLTGNQLIMTTHSPYLVNYLTMAIKAFKVRESYRSKDKNFDAELKEIVPIESLVDENEWAIYQLDEVKGSIGLLPHYKHLPEDDNLLNLLVRKINVSYDSLRQIEKNNA